MDLNQTRTKYSDVCDFRCRGKGPCAVGDSCNRETVTKGRPVEWERGLKSDDIAGRSNVLDSLDNRGVLLVDVDEGCWWVAR